MSTASPPHDDLWLICLNFITHLNVTDSTLRCLQSSVISEILPTSSHKKSRVYWYFRFCLHEGMLIEVDGGTYLTIYWLVTMVYISRPGEHIACNLPCGLGPAGVRDGPTPEACPASVGSPGLCFLSLHFIRSPETVLSQLIGMHILISWEAPLCFRLLPQSRVSPLSFQQGSLHPLSALSTGQSLWANPSTAGAPRGAGYSLGWSFLGAPLLQRSCRFWCSSSWCFVLLMYYLWLEILASDYLWFPPLLSPFLPIWKKQECALEWTFNQLVGWDFCFREGFHAFSPFSFWDILSIIFSPPEGFSEE